MHRYRRPIAAFAAFTLSIAMAACGGDDDDSTSEVDEPATEATEPETEATEPETEATEPAGDDTETTEPAGDDTDTTEPAESALPAVECPDSEQGVTDTEVVLGGSYPLSGPAAAYASIPVGIDAWFQHLNDTNGGVTFGDGVTREIVWNYLDDGYSPPKSLENVRKLIENDGVWFIFNPLGTPPNLAIRDYMNESEVPQLYVATGASTWGRDHDQYPWTIGFQPDYESEGIAYARYVLGENPDATMAVVYQNDDFGKDYLTGLEEAAGENIVAEITYEVTDATIDNQISQAVDSGADAVILIVTPKFAIQGIQRLAALGYEGIKVVSSVSSSVAAVIEPAGKDLATGFVSSVYLKDPTDPGLQDDPAIVEYKEILGQYHSDANPDDGLYLYGMNVAQGLQHTFESMTSVCRAGLMQAAENLDWEQPPLLRDGIGLHTGEGDYFPIQQVLLQEWDGEAWVPFGDVIDTGQ
jgi:branched-chain amino acid transport system substrate-binding protein